MPSVLSYCSSNKEIDILEKGIRDAIALKSDDYWSVKSYSELSQYVKAMDNSDELCVSCFDVTKKGAISEIESLRRKGGISALIIISDNTISPIQYLKPEIRASSLLLKPFTKTDVVSCVSGILNFYYDSIDAGKNTSQKFCVEAKEGKSYYPYSKIVYFEAREKKIFLNTENGEESFYSTLDVLEEKLPKYFARCHRSFIVNTKKITKIQPSQNLIFCEKDIVVPLSRSYKPSIYKVMGVSKE